MNTEIKNIIMISSLIKTTEEPLTYAKTRSVYTHQERFDQTLKTIKSVKNKIPESIICIVDCSPFTEEEVNTLYKLCNYFINLYDNNEYREIMRNGRSKSLAEAMQTFHLINFLKNNNIKYKNFFKISGRYELNDMFNYSLFDNNVNIGRIQPHMESYCLTSFYKINYETSHNLCEFIKNNIYSLQIGIPYEEFFKVFMSLNNARYLDVPLGIDEYISVNGEFRQH